MRILAIDPGREKCGAVIADDARILDRGVVPTADLARVLLEWGKRYGIDRVIVGDRTGQDEIRARVTSQLPDVPIATVREANTTLLARQRYFADHAPRGWRRLLPVSMQVPP